MTQAELLSLRQLRWRPWLTTGLEDEGLLRLVQTVGFLPATAPDATWPSLAAWMEANSAPPSDPQSVVIAQASAHAILARLLRAKRIVEVEIWLTGSLYLPAELLPFLYVWLGDRDPHRNFLRQMRNGSLSALAGQVYELLLAGPSRSASQIRDQLGPQRTSVSAVRSALQELALSLKVLKVDIAEPEPQWQPLCTAFPEAPGAISAISRSQAAAALVARFLEVAGTEEETEIARFLAPVLSRAAVRSSLWALQAAHQVETASIDGRPAFHWVE